MTALSDDFNRANSGTVGAPWTEILNDAGIVSNALASVTLDGDILVRYDSDLATSDHYSEVVVQHQSTSPFVGAAARMNASDTACYFAIANRTDAGTPRTTIRHRSSGGTVTVLATYNAGVASGDTLRLEVNGSTLTAFINGVSVLSITDTTIATGVRGGVYLNGNGGALNAARANSWAAQDLSKFRPYFLSS